MSDVTKELIKTADQIRRKYRALKRGREVIEDSRIESLKPIVEPLREIVETQKAFKPLPPITPAITITPPTPKPLSRLTEAPLTPRRIMTIGNIARGYLSYSLEKEQIADHTY